MSNERRDGIPRAAGTRGNDRQGAYSLGMSFSRAWLPPVKNPGLFAGLSSSGEKIDSLLLKGEGLGKRSFFRDSFVSALLVSLLTSLISTLSSGCRTGPSPLQFAPGAMVLHLATRDDIPTLDPVAGYDTASWAFEQMLFDTLVRYSDSGVELVPDAATRWESSADARTFTFHLRHDIRFSNGRAVTSTDFKYQIERVLDPVNNSQGIEYYRAIAGAEQYSSGQAKAVAGIDTPTPRQSFSIWLRLIQFSSPKSRCRLRPRSRVRRSPDMAGISHATLWAVARLCSMSGRAASELCW